MAMYQLLPSPDLATKEESYAFWENGFSPSEIARIRTYGDRLLNLNGATAIVGPSGTEDPNVRKSKIAWMDYDLETNWLYDRLAFIVRQINGQFFQFDISAFSESFQYTVYTGDDKAFYDWHIDKGYNQQGLPPRKLSLVMMLSDPSEYEGGELQLADGVVITPNMGLKAANPVEEVEGIGYRALAKAQGMVHLFPSWALHRVTPVTKGTRRTLVIWVCGPRFR